MTVVNDKYSVREPLPAGSVDALREFAEKLDRYEQHPAIAAVRTKIEALLDTVQKADGDGGRVERLAKVAESLGAVKVRVDSLDAAELLGALRKAERQVQTDYLAEMGSGAGRAYQVREERIAKREGARRPVPVVDYDAAA